MGGRLIDTVETQLATLAGRIDLHVMTDDNDHKARDCLFEFPAEWVRLPATGSSLAKSEYVRCLNAEHVVAIGNGHNDAFMLEQAAVGIVVLGADGSDTDSREAADIFVQHAADGLRLLLRPDLLAAALRC